MKALASRRDRIYITGFMGSGKSTVGPRLASALGYDYIDIDEAIERAEGRSVREIFEEKGERYFRALERDLVQKIAHAPRLVVSLGGGTLMDPDNYLDVSGSGIIVYLKAAPEQLFRRLQTKADRPMLMDISGRGLSEEELRIRIQQLYHAREQVYTRADITVESGEHDVGATVDLIVKQIAAILE